MVFFLSEWHRSPLPFCIKFLGIIYNVHGHRPKQKSLKNYICKLHSQISKSSLTEGLTLSITISNSSLKSAPHLLMTAIVDQRRLYCIDTRCTKLLTLEFPQKSWSQIVALLAVACHLMVFVYSRLYSETSNTM